MNEDRFYEKIFLAKPMGNRPRGRPPFRWIDCVEKGCLEKTSEEGQGCRTIEKEEGNDFESVIMHQLHKAKTAEHLKNFWKQENFYSFCFKHILSRSALDIPEIKKKEHDE
ncbi:hypothetical protein TNCV_1052931 [Trichonephila clavipes]|nr:hypothetical protein TNCV_1052931 [Trichonephila clavipes]